jgi:hypothetical protein
LLAAIAVAGFCEVTEKPTAVQVLPTVAGGGVETWPRLMGRALEIIFGTKESAIHRLRIDPVHDRWPTDILEAWATCIWASEAALNAARAVPALSNLVPILAALAGRVVQLTALTAEERSSSEFLAVYEAMTKRFRDRLGLNEVNKPSADSTGSRSRNFTFVPGEKKAEHLLGGEPCRLNYPTPKVRREKTNRRANSMLVPTAHPQGVCRELREICGSARCPYWGEWFWNDRLELQTRFEP